MKVLKDKRILGQFQSKQSLLTRFKVMALSYPGQLMVRNLYSKKARTLLSKTKLQMKTTPLDYGNKTVLNGIGFPNPKNWIQLNESLPNHIRLWVWYLAHLKIKRSPSPNEHKKNFRR